MPIRFRDSSGSREVAASDLVSLLSGQLDLVEEEPEPVLSTHADDARSSEAGNESTGDAPSADEVDGRDPVSALRASAEREDEAPEPPRVDPPARDARPVLSDELLARFAERGRAAVREAETKADHEHDARCSHGSLCKECEKKRKKKVVLGESLMTYRPASGPAEPLVGPNLPQRLEEATAARQSAAAGSQEWYRARAVEVELARQMSRDVFAGMEIDDAQHARAVLACLNEAELSAPARDRIEHEAKLVILTEAALDDVDTEDEQLIDLLVQTQGDTLLDEATSSASLDRSPRKNWVEETGDLPRYVRKLARAIERKRGVPLSRAIAIAIGTVKRWARGGGDVNADTRAKAAAAVAAWTKLKAKNKARMAAKRAA